MECKCCTNRGHLGVKVSVCGTRDNHCMICGAYSASTGNEDKEKCTCGMCLVKDEDEDKECECGKNMPPMKKSTIGASRFTLRCQECKKPPSDISVEPNETVLRSRIVSNWDVIQDKLSGHRKLSLPEKSPSHRNIEENDAVEQVIEYIVELRRKHRLVDYMDDVWHEW